MLKRKDLIGMFLTGILLLCLSLSVSASNPDDWVVDVEEDPLTEEKEILIYKISEETIGNPDHDTNSLALRGGEGGGDLIIRWSDYLGDNNEVHYRFNDGDVEEMEWLLSEDSRALFYLPEILLPDEYLTAKEFIEKMIVHDELIVGIKPHNVRRQSDIFDVSNFGSIVEPYLEDFGMEELTEKIENND